MELLKVCIPELDIMRIQNQWVPCSSSFHPYHYSSIFQEYKLTVSTKMFSVLVAIYSQGNVFGCSFCCPVWFPLTPGSLSTLCCQSRVSVVHGQPSYWRFTLVPLLSRITHVLWWVFLSHKPEQDTAASGGGRSPETAWNTSALQG